MGGCRGGEPENQGVAYFLETILGEEGYKDGRGASRLWGGGERARGGGVGFGEGGFGDGVWTSRVLFTAGLRIYRTSQNTSLSNNC